MKGYYIFPTSREESGKSSGVTKKIQRHMKELGKTYEMTLVPLMYEASFANKIVSRLPFGSVKRNYKEVMDKIVDPAFVYIRRFNLDNKAVRFLKGIKRCFPNCKVVIEIFTYPYDKDEFLKDFKSTAKIYPFYLKDKYYRNRLVGTVDRFVTYSGDDEVFRIKTIKTINGYDFSDIKIKEIDKNIYDCNKINLISVAYMQPHHGYERIIKGMTKYYEGGKRKREVFFHVVGDGPEIEKYKRLTEEGNITDYVLFYGKREGRDLDDIYEKCDIGVCSFGMYKLGIESASSLKIPEYYSKGLPIIAGSKISTLESRDIAYCLEFENNSSDIDIESIISFYDSVYYCQHRTEIVRSIQSYAEEHFSESRALRPIIDYLASGDPS